jgi:hypothetical protein
MNASQEIKDLAYLRLSEAEILCEAGKFDGAFYLAGYSVELMLKAKICEHWGIPNLFAETNYALVSFNLGNSCAITDGDLQTRLLKIATNALRKEVKTHDINLLLHFSGLIKEFNRAQIHNRTLRNSYQFFNASTGKQTDWNERVRYLPINSKREEDVKEFIALLNDSNGILKWIENN